MAMTRNPEHAVRIKDAISLLQDCITKGEKIKINPTTVSEYSGLTRAIVYNHPLMRQHINRRESRKKAALLDSYIETLKDGYFEHHENLDDVRKSFKNDRFDTDSGVLQQAINLLIKDKIIVPHLTQPNTYIKAAQDINRATAPEVIYALIVVKGKHQSVMSETELDALIESILMKDPAAEVDVYKKVETVKMQVVRQAA
ncbi:hypothetical protein PMO31116_00505 [Pandoraea morbifera]|uniref:Uncharacterized protein n=1 Tax=Pandoraea morbifera TaxID=2508300 RepID=A0A5E4S0J6_9BURK|nr:hypothetical protein [Pandoraea morbifera]VVD69107.1 hypothetical protein PMO31116_00505 [Pandoraea morbifera]